MLALIDRFKGPYVRIGPRETAISDIEAHQIIHRVGSDYNKAPWYELGRTSNQYWLMLTDVGTKVRRRHNTVTRPQVSSAFWTTRPHRIGEDFFSQLVRKRL